MSNNNYIYFPCKCILESFKKILPTLLKISIGLFSFLVIFNKLSQTAELKNQIIASFDKPNIYIVILTIIALMPINWGIESFKWKLCTEQVEIINYKTALKSVYTGICLGNIAPGRAMEFVAKIYFFKPENRPSVTILHFINGMFQMLITVLLGLISIAYKLSTQHSSSTFIYSVIIGGICLLLLFCLAILNVSFIQKKLRFIKWFNKNGNHDLKFSTKLLSTLIALSILRYFVFTFQFYILYINLNPGSDILSIITSIAAYFMLTSLIPMISIIEPAIRAAIALFVFNQDEAASIGVIICATTLWVVNVVIPSLIGYAIILREKIEFKSKHAD